MILYLPAYKAGFIAEFINYLQSFHDESFISFINRDSAYVKSMYQVLQLQGYVLLSLFGTHPIPWFLLFTALHALNGVLVYHFFLYLFTDFSLKNPLATAFAGSLLFLFNPNITEILVWKSCEQYLLGVLLQILILTWVRQFLILNKTIYAWLAGIVFAITTYTLEIFYVTPLFTLFIILGYYQKDIIDKITFQKALKILFLPQVFLFVLHLVLFKFIYGSWIAHYGTTTEFITEPKTIISSYGKYLSYLGGMSGHYPWSVRQHVYSFISLPVVCYSITGFILIFIVIGIWQFRKLSSSLQIILFLLATFTCSIALCLPTYFDDLFSLYNSRRCYQPGIFFYMLVAVCFFSIDYKKLPLVLSTLYISICVALTINMAFRWRHAAKIQYGVLRTFQWQKTPTVVLLNLPAYYEDIRVIPSSADNEFADHLRFFGYPVMQGKLYSVVGYNMNHNWDGAHVTVQDSLSLKVTLNQWGSWWMHNYNGATDYENELYKVKMTDPGHEYNIIFKHKPDSNMAILFQQGEQWRLVDMNRKDEQW